MATSPLLDRRVEFDKRSRDFPIRTLLAREAKKKPRSYTWRVDLWLDQGTEGACVGYAWAHEGAARPVVVKDVDVVKAWEVYRLARTLDQWPGEGYEGTSVLAGAKAVQTGILGKPVMQEYRWAFGLEDLVLAVGYHGPAVLGINWYDGMFRTDAKGFVNVDGDVAGGHAILCHAVNVRDKYAVLWNSWGSDWGQGGRARISFDNLDRLLHEQGEACIPVRRR